LDPQNFYSIFWEAFEKAYTEFTMHISNHPSCSLFKACQVFDPIYFKYQNLNHKDLCQYFAIKEFENPSDQLLREWSIYCGLENTEITSEVSLDKYWLNLSTHLLIISGIALDYIWLPISECSVEQSFSKYNNLLSSDCQNLSKESLKMLSMLYFNGVFD